ncbi:MAG: RNA-binding protein [Anaeroplasmataceae bacterium]
MKPINEKEEMFFKRIRSLKEKAINNYQISNLKFLDIRQQEIVKYIIGYDCYLYFDGGYVDSEYKKCIISPFEIEEPLFNIDILKLKYNPKFLNLNHRKVMACILDLGIKREVFGDIIFNNEACYICVSSEMSEYFINNLRLISHTPVELVLSDDDIKNIITLEEKKVYVSSLRIDTVISGMYNISRKISQELVLGEYVKVNQAIITNTSYNLNIGDILSVRGKGRFKVINILGNTRSDRYVLQLGKYV